MSGVIIVEPMSDVSYCGGDVSYCGGDVRYRLLWKCWLLDMSSSQQKCTVVIRHEQ